MPIKYIVTGLILWLMAASASAQLAGKNVILIHGFKPQHILSPPSDEGLADALAYWVDFEPTIMDPATSRILHWPSNRRLSGAGGIAAVITAQLKPILESGFCDDQCILITHSTGDLVARYVLSNKLSLFGPTLAGRFKVAAVIDMAGAGGGTELANLAVDAVKGVNTGAAILKALSGFVGYDFQYATTPGVLVDLQPGIARNTAVSKILAIPHLRVVGSGTDLFGLITHPLIKGKDDSVVPLHSACGAANNDAYDSCEQDLRMNGQVSHVSKAPSPSQLYDYHYPIILTAGVSHNEMQINKTGNDMTFALSNVDAYNNSDAKTLNAAVAQKTYRVWWDWFHDYRVITGAKEKSVGRVIADSFQ